MFMDLKDHGRRQWRGSEYRVDSGPLVSMIGRKDCIPTSFLCPQPWVTSWVWPHSKGIQVPWCTSETPGSPNPKLDLLGQTVEGGQGSKSCISNKLPRWFLRTLKLDKDDCGLAATGFLTCSHPGIGKNRAECSVPWGFGHWFSDVPYDNQVILVKGLIVAVTFLTFVIWTFSIQSLLCSKALWTFFFSPLAEGWAGESKQANKHNKVKKRLLTLKKYGWIGIWWWSSL